MHSTAYVTKQLCFINLETNQQTALYVSLQNIQGQLSLASTIEQFNSHNYPVRKRHFAVDPAGLQTFQKPYLLNRELFHHNPLILYYRDEAEGQIAESEQSFKKERNKQRTIRQVIESIKKWRSFHKKRIDGVKVSLVQAADMVGMSKKSLDDYFCQLRLGEKYGFEFMEHLDDKIGVLRSFVKKNRPKHDRAHKNEKHPKTLKIIEQFELIDNSKEQSHLNSQVRETSENHIEEQQKDVVEVPLQNEGTDDINLTPMDKQQAEELENQFFQLDLILNEPTDPFVHYLARDYRDFKKKDYGLMDSIIRDEEDLQQSEFMW